MQSRRSQAIKAGILDFKLNGGFLNGNVGTSSCPRWRKCWSWD